MSQRHGTQQVELESTLRVRSGCKQGQRLGQDEGQDKVWDGRTSSLAESPTNTASSPAMPQTSQMCSSASGLGLYAKPHSRPMAGLCGRHSSACQERCVTHHRE